MEKIDIFGSNFSFTINQSKTFKTRLGGCLTIISLILCFLMSIFLGKDFFYRLNPKVLEQNIILKKNEKIKISNSNYTMAWRIEDSISNRIDYEGFFFPKIYYYHYETKKINDKNEFVVIEKIKLESKNCTSMKKNINSKFVETINTNEWLCVDLSNSDPYFGGDWGDEFLYYISMTFETCESDINLSNNTIKPKCNNQTSLRDFVNKEVYLSVMIPQTIFSYSSIDEPLELIYHNFYRNLDLTLIRSDNCMFNRKIIEDDQGWITKNLYNITSLNFVQSLLTLSYINQDKYIDNANVKFYEINFYLTKTLIFSRRIFMKLQDLGAIMGGFFNIVIIIFKALNSNMNEFERRKMFISKFFKYSINSEKNCEKFSYYKTLNQNLWNNNFRNSQNLKGIQKGKNIVSNFTKNKNYNPKELNINLEKNFTADNFNIKANEETIDFNAFSNKEINDQYKYLSYLKNNKISENNNSIIELKNSQTNENSLRISNYEDISPLNATQEKFNNIKKKIQKLKLKNNTNSITAIKYLADIQIEEKENFNKNFEDEEKKRHQNICISNKKTNYNRVQAHVNTIDKNGRNKDLQENPISLKDLFNFKELIKNSQNLYKDVYFIDYLKANLCKKNKKKNKFYEKYFYFNNGIMVLNKNLDLLRYLKNIEMVRIMGKILLNKDQRYFIKNFKKDILDKDYIYDELGREKRHKKKYNSMIKYFEEICDKDYESIIKMDKFMIENIFNS